MPTALDVDSGGKVYVALSGVHQVAEYTLVSGSYQQTRLLGKSDQTSGTGNGEFNAPYDVVVMAGGETIAVSDSGNHRIQEFKTADGSFVRSFGTQGSGVGQFNTPKGLACDRAGNLYIVDSANNRIAVARSSVVIGVGGDSGAGLGQFQGAVNLALGPRGIYVAETGNNRVQAFDPISGGYSGFAPLSVRLALPSSLGFSQPHAIAPISDPLTEKLYVADTAGGRIIAVTLPEAQTPDAIWNEMKTSLLAGSIDDAIEHFADGSKEDYRASFIAMGSAAIASVMNKVLTPVAIDGDTARYSFQDTIAGQTITFPVAFIRENGIWKIAEF